MTIKYFSMFSGIGGFEYGIEQSKLGKEFECIGFSEIDRFAESIYSRHFPTHKNYGDATEIRTEDLPDFDFLVGGFPCQAFSNAGLRRGFDDTRGTLFFEIARILKDKRPRYFLLENVKGLLHHDKGKTFQTILEVLSDLGYYVKWEVLNSKDFGVPQRRERVFIKGYSRRECGGEVLSFRESHEKNTGKLNSSISVNDKVQSDFQKVDEGVYMTTSVEGDSFAVTTRNRESPLHKKQDNYVLEECIGSTQKHASRTDGSYCPTLTCAMGKGGGHIPMLKLRETTKKGYKEAYPFDGVLTNRGNRKIAKGIVRDQECGCLQTSGIWGTVTSDFRIRKLTPKECERLQGFPDDWTKYGKDDELISDTQRYKCCGNAVTTNVITAIINEVFGNEDG